MIRINLLPVRQSRRVAAGARQMVVFVVLILAAMGVMFLLYQTKSSEVDSKTRSVRLLRQDIEKLKKEVGDFDRLRKQRNRLLKQQRTIQQLKQAKTGPVRMLRELSEILSKGKGPTIDQQRYEKLLRINPRAGYNPNWNPRRLWIDNLDEKNKQLEIIGRAKDQSDVVELLRRLTLSEFFEDVMHKDSNQRMDDKAGFKVVNFVVTCRLNY